MPRYRRFRPKIASQVSTRIVRQVVRVRQKAHGKRTAMVKLFLSASIPLMIAVFTIVTYVQQMQINEENRERDERYANATRDKDLEIANLTRVQDQMIANITRLHDLDIANLTQAKDWEIAAASLNIANETKIQDRQIAEENRDEDRARQQDLHCETVYSKYIDDISTILYKQADNQSTFVNAYHKVLYIRRKTLITLRSIDSERRSQLFVFLHENHLLPDLTDSNNTVSLAGADLRNIVIESPVTGAFEFKCLSLKSANLINATFIGCTFRGDTNFTGSIMHHVTFADSVFEGRFVAFKVRLLNASFTNCTFKGEADFNGSSLQNVRFSQSQFEMFSAGDVDLSGASFLDCVFVRKANFVNTVMDGTCFQESRFSPYQAHQFNQVSLKRADFRRTWIRNVVFLNCNITQGNFSNAYLRDIKFASQVNLANVDFRNTTLVSIDFSQTNLTGAHINLKDAKELQLDNVVLPNGTWLISSKPFLRNGNAETGCPRSDGSNAAMHWKQEIGTIMSYQQGAKGCSFKCMDTEICRMRQLISLSKFMLFIDTGDIEYTLSANVGTKSECAQGLVKIGIINRRESAAKEISNQHLRSTGKGIQWQRLTQTASLFKEDGDGYYARVMFGENSTACFVDDIEFRLRKKAN